MLNKIAHDGAGVIANSHACRHLCFLRLFVNRESLFDPLDVNLRPHRLHRRLSVMGFRGGSLC